MTCDLLDAELGSRTLYVWYEMHNKFKLKAIM